MRRLLFILMAVLGTFWWLRRSLGRHGSQQGRGRPGGASGAVLEGSMVRDRICNTFLPRSKALMERSGSEEHFFCSEACRRKYLAKRAS